LTIVEGHNAHTVLGLSEPRNPMEQQVARIWREVLNLSYISIDQNFFELGGDSLTAIRLTHKLRETCHVSLPVRDLFENPTIRALATLIAEGTTQQEANKPISSAESRLGSASELLSSLDQLTDDEVDILLAGMSDSEFPR
jgi:acyl carrier protein